MSSPSELPLGAADIKTLETAPGERTVIIDGEEAVNLDLYHSVLKFPKLTGYILAVCSALMLYGYDTAIVGTISAMPTFQEDYGELLDDELIIPSSWLSAWTASGPIGNMLGSLAAGWIHDRFGRRMSLGFSAIIVSIGVGICYASHTPADIDTRRGIFLLGSFVVGFAVGQAICTTQTYISEIVPKTLRGPVFALFPIFSLLSQLIAAVIIFHFLPLDGASTYLSCIASEWPFGFVLLIVAVLIPESPAYLISRGKIDAAYKAQARLHLAGVDTEAEVNQLVAVLAQEKDDSHSNDTNPTYLQCFTGVDRRRTLIVILTNVMPCIFGVPLLGNVSYFLQTIGMDASDSVLLLQVGIGIGLFANIIAIWSLSVAPRRPLMLVTLGLVALLWMAIGIAGCYTGDKMIWFSAVAMMLILFTVSCGVWPASVVVGSESSSLRLRGKAQAIGWLNQGLWNGVFAIVLPYAYNPDQGNLGSQTGFIFFGLCVVGFAAVYFYIPEMKGRTSSEIDAMFNSKISARNFRQWEAGSLAESKEDYEVENVQPTKE